MTLPFDSLRYIKIIKTWDYPENRLSLLGRYNGKYVVISIEKPVSDIVYSGHFDIIEHNDVYYQCVYASTKISLVYPATENHIAKIKPQRFYIVKETPEVYQNVTLPFIQSLLPDHTRWVDNILNGSAEADKIMFNNDRFVIVPDIKWKTNNRHEMHYLAIVKNENFKTLRDLDGNSIELLEEILREGYGLIETLYGTKQNSLRVFLHYQPSFYHLHIHFCHIDNPNQSSFLIGRAILLNDIIQNLRMDGDYYKHITIQFVIGAEQELYSQIKKYLES